MPSAVNNIDPTVATALGVGKGAELNSQAYLKQCLGDVKGAERAYLEAIKVREQGLGTEHHLTAISYNGLGELYMVMEQLGQAEEYLNKALAIRIKRGFPEELAVTRDSLGRLFEMKGDLHAAAEMRLQGGPDNVACSNYSGCVKFSNSLADLLQCNMCKAVLYCSDSCRDADWTRHKQYCRIDNTSEPTTQQITSA